MRLLEEFQVDILPWPAQSPDFSTIEYVWDIMDWSLRALPNPPENLQDLEHRLQRAWDGIPQPDIDNLIKSMPRRVNVCIRARADISHY
jgi:hypothetical protein